MKISDQNRERIRWLLSLFLHSFVAMVVCVLVGLFPEGAFSRYIDPRLESFGPIVALTTVAIGYFVSQKIATRAATSVWIVGALWMSYGIYDAISTWSSEWSTHPTRWSDAKVNLFTLDCESSECLGQLIFTIPFVAAIAYTLGAWLRKLDTR
jgi:hypothetical protein